MADVQRIIEIVFNATDNAGTKIKGVSKDLGAISRSIEGMTQPLADAHDRVLKLEAALGALAVGGMALAIKAAGEFDGQFREISTLIDASANDIDTFREDVKLYAQGSSASLETINKSLYSAISAGTDYKDAIMAIGQAEKLADAGVADLNDTMLVLVSTMNAYGAGASEAEKYSDILFTTVKEGQTTLPQLAASLAQVTSIAAAAGVPFETLAATIATLTAKGMSTEQAMTAIKGTITSIISPSAEAATAAKNLGIQFDAAALESKGLEGVLQEVYAVTGGNIEQMSSLFGNVRGLTGVLAAFGNDGGDMFLDKLAAMQDASGATATAYDKMAGDFNKINQNLLTNVRLTFIELGEEMLGSYGDIVGSVSEIFKAFQGAIGEGAFDDVFAVLDELADSISAKLLQIAENLPEALEKVDFSGFSAAIKDLVGETGDLLENIFGGDLSTADGLEKAIQRVVNVVTTLTNVTSGIIDSWQKWAGWLGDLIDYMADTDAETAKNIGSFLQWGKVLNEIAGPVLGGLSSGLNSLASLMIVMHSTHLTGMVSGLGAVATKMGSLGGSIAALATGPAGILALAAGFGALVGTLLNTIPAVQKVSQSMWGLVDGIIDFTGQEEQAIKHTELLASTVNKLVDNMGAFSDPLDDLRDSLSGMGKAVDDLPRDVILKMAYDEGLVTDERLREIIGTKKEIADKDPINLSMGIDDVMFQAELDDIERETVEPFKEKVSESITFYIDADGIKHFIDEGQIIVDDNPIVIEPEIDKTKEFEAAMGALETLVSGFYDTIQTQVEWEAKLEIAEVEANAQKIEAIMESVGMSATGAADVLSSIFGNIADIRKIADRYTIQDWIDEQIEIQKGALEIQKEIAEAEAKYLEARTQRLLSGEPLITVTGDGLQPHLEGFMWEILGAVQTRVTEEGADMLLGL